MSKNENNVEEKRPYEKPLIQSSETYERFALSCTGGGIMGGSFDCALTKDGPAGSCSAGCVGS